MAQFPFLNGSTDNDPIAFHYLTHLPARRVQFLHSRFKRVNCSTRNRQQQPSTGLWVVKQHLVFFWQVNFMLHA